MLQCFLIAQYPFHQSFSQHLYRLVAGGAGLAAKEEDPMDTATDVVTGNTAHAAPPAPSDVDSHEGVIDVHAVADTSVVDTYVGNGLCYKGCCTMRINERSSL